MLCAHQFFEQCGHSRAVLRPHYFFQGSNEIRRAIVTTWHRVEDAYGAVSGTVSGRRRWVAIMCVNSHGLPQKSGGAKSRC
jgi:hypothetical protein